MAQTGPNLYLVGFTGTGKSTVGRSVAQQLGYQFLDSDHEIERLSGRTITQIFSEEGEPVFRALERKFIAEQHPAGGCVVACGGGLIVPDGMLELLHERGVVICLHASLETVIERTARSVHRPLVSGEDREDKQAKDDTARTMWVPAVNAEATFGRWAFVEIRDPLCAQSTLRAALDPPTPEGSQRLAGG